MQTRNRIFDDLAKLANSATGTMAGLKDEIENMVRYRMEGFMSDMNMVSREEFDAVKVMAAKARSEQAKLEKRIVELDAKLDRAALTPRAKKKTATAKKSAKK
ncbi:MAG: hypothetical protein CBD27_12810 [Rhodospirillaceae bacterium TMED167]|nr:pyrroline-5-carboxylate reductase [Rhodospirillaceae bacterium]OUW22896.1 MAG: hypothetical protein CBD27_12810 [Rhodospirillaceae bacterium TMED167]